MTRAEAIELAMTERRRHGLPGFDGRCHCGYVGDWTTDERFDAWSRHVEGDIIDALLEAGMTFGEDPIPRYAQLDVWMALGGKPRAFEEWRDTPGRTFADAWAQLLGAIRGDLMVGDHNPEPGDSLLALIWQREAPRSSSPGRVEVSLISHVTREHWRQEASPFSSVQRTREVWVERAIMAVDALDEAEATITGLREALTGLLAKVEPYGIGTSDLGPCIGYYHARNAAQAALARPEFPNTERPTNA